MKMSLAETDERNKNHNNIIIHRVLESKSSKPTEKQAHDHDILQIILKKLGLSNIIRAEDIKFIRRIGDKKEQQQARPLKVGLIYHYKKELLMEAAKNHNKIQDFQHISIGHDLTEIQRMGETSLWKKACNQNLNPNKEMTDKKLVMKVVGPGGQRRIIAAPLRRTEEVDKEGRVRVRKREGARSREEQGGPFREVAPASIATGANREPLGRREQGNGQGAAAGGANRREQQETSRAAQEVRLLRPGRWCQSSACGEEGMERRKERQEVAPRSLAQSSGVRREEGRSSLLQVSRFSMSPASPGMAEVRLQ